MKSIDVLHIWCDNWFLFLLFFYLMFCFLLLLIWFDHWLSASFDLIMCFCFHLMWSLIVGLLLLIWNWLPWFPFHKFTNCSATHLMCYFSLQVCLWIQRGTEQWIFSNFPSLMSSSSSWLTSQTSMVPSLWVTPTRLHPLPSSTTQRKLLWRRCRHMLPCKFWWAFAASQNFLTTGGSGG